jgi:hypothetical protein
VRVLYRDGDGTAESEVSDLERHGLAVHEQVVRFQITVEHPAAVNKTHALAQLVHQDLQTHQGHQLSQADAGNTSTQTPRRAQGLVVPLERNRGYRKGEIHLDGLCGDLLVVGAIAPDELLQVGVHVLEDEVQDGLPLLVDALLEVEQADHVRVLRQHPQQRDLPQRGGRHALVVLGEPRLLERHDPARRLLPGLVHLPVRALPHLLQLLVQIHGAQSAARRRGRRRRSRLVLDRRHPAADPVFSLAHDADLGVADVAGWQLWMDLETGMRGCILYRVVGEWGKRGDRCDFKFRLCPFTYSKNGLRRCRRTRPALRHRSRLVTRGLFFHPAVLHLEPSPRLSFL